MPVAPLTFDDHWTLPVAGGGVGGGAGEGVVGGVGVGADVVGVVGAGDVVVVVVPGVEAPPHPANAPVSRRARENARK